MSQAGDTSALAVLEVVLLVVGGVGLVYGQITQQNRGDGGGGRSST